MTYLKPLLFALLSLAVQSCKKDSASNASINGSWKLVEVKNLSTNQTFRKPTDLNDVVVRFDGDHNGGTITGTTVTNKIMESPYTLGSSETISIAGISVTKISEPEWGLLFLDNIPHAKRYKIMRPYRLRIFTDDVVLEFSRQ